jgi:hypothetical protein
VAVEKCPAASPRGIEFGGKRMVDDPKRQLAADNQADRNAPDRNPGQKIVGAVYRIDYPERPGIEVAGSALFPQEAVVGEEPGEPADSRRAKWSAATLPASRTTASATRKRLSSSDPCTSISCISGRARRVRPAWR